MGALEFTNQIPTDEYNRRTVHEPPPRRDTINVKRAPLPNDKDWLGAAPKPMPDRDKRWRPSEFKF